MQTVQALASIMQCKASSFPLIYLGLPLSDRILPKSAFQPMLERIQRKLSGWKAPTLSVEGRHTLTNAVITTIPVYYMTAFLLPKWVLRSIDKIRRRFLWHGHKEGQLQKRPMYLASWQLVTRPKQLGGLGVRDMESMNKALLMK
jgi:hypothetical protein